MAKEHSPKEDEKKVEERRDAVLKKMLETPPKPKTDKAKDKKKEAPDK